MDKQQLLNEVSQMVSSGQLTKDEVLAVIVPKPGGRSADRHMNLSEILYYIGGGIVFLGIAVLVYQNWDTFSGALRIFITLGSCIACFIVAALLYRYENLRKVAQAFFLLFGMLLPLGVGVVFYQAGYDLSSNAVQALMYLILSAVIFLSFWYYKQTILLFFGIIFATALFHFILALIIGDNLTYVDASKIWEYEFLVIGLVYMLIGYYLTRTSQAVLSGVMYGFGSLMFLGSTIALGGWQPNQNTFWELIYPLLVFGIIFLSVYLKSKTFLTFGTIFLIAYILKLTGEYFQSGLGWPLALVIAGLLIILVGYYAVRISKKYIVKTA